MKTRMRMPDPKTPETHGQPLMAPSPVEDVFAATEAVRAADFPTVSAQLLAEILAAERENPDDRVAAAKAVGRALDAHLRENPVDSADTDGGTNP
jgi:hypothetical protein